MIKLNLYDKSEEIYKALPKRYVEIILNSIIAQSLNNGNLLKEATNFLSSKDLETMSNELNFKIEMKKNSLPVNKIKGNISEVSFSKGEEISKKEMSSFEGFDI